MPNLGRDAQSDSSRTGKDRKERGEWMYDIDVAPMTLAEEKWADPNAPGTGNDHAGTTTEVHRRNVRRRKPPTWAQ